MGTIFWMSHSIESCNWIDFISVAYASWYHWNWCRTQRKAATINQFACPSYSLYVQMLWHPMYYPGGMKARVSPVQWSKPHSILAPTQYPNPGGRIQNHKRWPLDYHCTHKVPRTSINYLIWLHLTFLQALWDAPTRLYSSHLVWYLIRMWLCLLSPSIFKTYYISISSLPANGLLAAAKIWARLLSKKLFKKLSQKLRFHFISNWSNSYCTHTMSPSMLYLVKFFSILWHITIALKLFFNSPKSNGASLQTLQET